MTRLAILADDLTGAADAGAAFAGAGLATTIAFMSAAAAFAGATATDIDVLVLCTDSRDLDATAAAQLNRGAAEALIAAPVSRRPRWVYKKIDSALRGHPRDELLAVMAGLGESKALVAPALPAEGRVTLGGRQFVDGSPVEATSLGSPGMSSDLAALFGRGGSRPVHVLGLDTVRKGTDEIEGALAGITSGLVVADAETDLDLSLLARAALSGDLRVLAGSAGLARQIARTLASTPAPTGAAGPDLPVGPVLVVAGSLHDATSAQVETLRMVGMPIVRPEEALLDGRSSSGARTAEDLARHLAAGRSAVLTTAGSGRSRLGPTFVAARLAELVAAPGVRRHLGGLVLTGGETAAGVLAAVGATELRLAGEIRPAMPWGVLSSSRLPTMPVATKAGSFGSADALLACVEHLTGRRRR